MATSLSWNDWVNLHRGAFNAQQTDAGRGDAPIGPRYDESGNLIRPVDDAGNPLPFNPYSASSYAGGVYDPLVHLQNTPFWAMGYRPGMDMPWREDNGSLVSGLVEMGVPLASTVGLGLGIGTGLNALTGGAMGIAPGAIGSQFAALGGGAEAATAGAQFPSQVMSAGQLMPAAVPETAATLSEWGLTEISPGVWAAGGAAGAGAAAAGASAAAPATGAGTVSYGGAAPAGAAGATGGLSTFGTGASLGGLGSLGAGALGSPQILGALGGAVLGGLGGTGETETMTTAEGLPDWLLPYVKPQLDKYASELQNYQVDPYGIMPSASSEFKNTISGMYLDPATNQYLEKFFNAGAERVKSNLAPSFGHMQAFGSHSGYNEALSRGLSDLSLGLYGGAYEKERDRMSQMTAAAPSFLTQNTQAQFSPYSQYFQSIGSLGRKKEQPVYTPGPLQGILGGAMAGYGLGSIFK